MRPLVHRAAVRPSAAASRRAAGMPPVGGLALVLLVAGGFAVTAAAEHAARELAPAPAHGLDASDGPAATHPGSSRLARGREGAAARP